MSRLLLGPLLRHVGPTDATIWVETDRPCEVEVLGCRERTWTVAGHHYAVVVVEGLEPGTSTPYEVRLDGQLAWPLQGSPWPPSRIRTVAPGKAMRIAFGSCRYASVEAVSRDRRFQRDALDAFAVQLARSPDSDWPDALVLLGDQVYADKTSRATRRRIKQRRNIRRGAGSQVADYEEYTWLYAESWTDPNVRWLLSTVPSSMIFDDHDVRDDWNISASWRLEMRDKPWWHERIVGALASYWIYQHLGNLSPGELAQDPLYQQVRAGTADAEPLVREFAEAADRELDGAKGTRWSYRRDFGSVRLLVIDSRCGRILHEDRRSMLSQAEFDWIEAQLDGDYEHLLIGTSLPWLLPRALHDLEAWNEVLCEGHRGERIAGASEKLRRRADFEHWAAFGTSFDRLAALVAAAGRGEYGPRGRAPATVCVLSGDVHHAYVARAQFGTDVRSPVYQLTCSPLHNRVPAVMRAAFRAAWSSVAERWTSRALGVVVKVPVPSVEWVRLAGPYFGNDLMTLRLDGPSAHLVLEQAGPAEDGGGLRQVISLTLA